MLFLDVQRKIVAQSTAETDKVQWTLSQTEVEFLLLHEAMEHALYGVGTLDEVRLRYDVLFSRSETFTHGAPFARLQEDSDFRHAFSALLDWIDRTVLLIDGPDDRLHAALPRLLDEAHLLRPTARQLALTGIRVFSATSDAARKGVARTLEAVGLLALVMIALLLGMVVVLWRLDLTNRRSAAERKETLERLEAIIATALDAVIAIDDAGRIVEFNAAATEVFGYPRGEAIGQDMARLLLPPPERDAHDAGTSGTHGGTLSAVIGQGRVRREAQRADGSIFPVELSVAQVASGGQRLLVAFLRDLSSEVAAERALMAARDEALAGERTKAHLLAVMGHEMRTPLNGLIGMVDLMAGTPLDTRQEEYLAAMRTSGQILLQHVNDVLDIARLEAGRLPAREEIVDLDAMIEEVFATQRAAAQAKGNRLVLEPDITGAGTRHLRGDPLPMRQMLMNLVGNAVKFTRDGTVTVRLRLEAVGGRTVIEVSDTGIGIPPEDQDRIFEDFVMLDPSLSRAAGGTGLGLGITRRIIQNLGGRIRVESTPGEGSTFAVDLPLAPVPAPAVAQPAALPPRPDPPTRPLNVLVVEDNAINRLVAGEMLARLGHRVTEASDGLEGVRRAGAEGFDVILMDISMPEMDGIAASRAIRAGQGPSHAAPILALTAHAGADDFAGLFEAGFDAVLIKPVPLEGLAAALARLEGSRIAPVPAVPPSAPLAPRSRKRDKSLLDDAVLDDLLVTLGPAKGAKTLSAFRNETRDGIAALTPDLPPEDLRRAAHRLAGATALFGCATLASALREVETLATTGTGRESLASVLARLGPLWRRSERAMLDRAGKLARNGKG